MVRCSKVLLVSANLGLDRANRQGCERGDAGGQDACLARELRLARDEPVHDTEGRHLLGGERIRGEEHLLGDVQGQPAHEVGDACGVVGNAEFHGSDRETGGSHRHDEIAGEDEIACAAPDSALDCGDDREGRPPDGPEELLEWIGPGERIGSIGGEFADVVACGPGGYACLGTNDDRASRPRLSGDEGVDEFAEQAARQRIALLRI